MVITHNIYAANAQRQFRINERNKNKNSERLSSGYKINRAADDAAGLSISEKLRSQVRKLHQAANNVEDGTSLIKTADGALNEVHNILARQRELLVKAANDTNTDDDRQAIEDELLSLHDEYNHIFEDTQFNGIYVFQGEDTITDGPNTTTNNRQDVTIDTTDTKVTSKIIWVNKGAAPPANTHTVNPTVVVNSHKETYEETETVNSVNADGYTLYDEHSIYTSYSYEDQYDTIVDVKHESVVADSKYTNLVKPGDMVGNNGYINVTNEAGNLNLSCAMSQLGVKVDGVVKSLDLYGSGYPKTTTVAADKSWAETTYEIEPGLTVTQKIALTGANGSQSYLISYGVKNTTGVDHQVDVRLAFDTMNTQVTGKKNQLPYTLDSDFASIQISAINTKSSALGSINNLYGSWDDSKIVVGNNEGTHSGVGLWWSENIITGNDFQIGSATYGPITLKQDPYKVTTTTENKHKQLVDITQTEETTTILPEYLDIQHGANAGEKLPIRMYSIDTSKLKCEVGQGKPISAFHAQDSLDHIDRVVKKISSIRSYYGAMQNRLETIYDADLNYSENLEQSESVIRDTDMATEMLQYSKNNVLQEAAQSMITQANKNNQSILNLLQ